MSVPILFFGQGFVNAVVEIFVVGENNMAANIVKLFALALACIFSNKSKKTYEAFWSHIRRSKATRCSIGVNDHPRGTILKSQSQSGVSGEEEHSQSGSDALQPQDQLDQRQ